jgi:hypothetical protein
MATKNGETILNGNERTEHVLAAGYFLLGEQCSQLPLVTLPLPREQSTLLS